MAFGASASQCSVYTGLGAGRATDGIINTEACTLALASVQEWWSVDLGYRRLVMGVWILHETGDTKGKYQRKLTDTNQNR